MIALPDAEPVVVDQLRVLESRFGPALDVVGQTLGAQRHQLHHHRQCCAARRVGSGLGGRTDSGIPLAMQSEVMRDRPRPRRGAARGWLEVRDWRVSSPVNRCERPSPSRMRPLSTDQRARGVSGPVTHHHISCCCWAGGILVAARLLRRIAGTISPRQLVSCC